MKKNYLQLTVVAAAFLMVGALLGGCYTATSMGGDLAPQTSNMTVQSQTSVKVGNYYWVSKTFKLKSYSGAYLTAHCPPSYVVLGGGVNVFKTVGFYGPDNYDASFPTKDYNGWTVSVGDQQPAGFVVYASCAPKV